MRAATCTLLIAGVIATALGCERSTPAPKRSPIGVPPDAVLVVSAPSLSALRELAAPLEPLPAAPGDDEQRPAWLACEATICLLRRAASVESASTSNGTTVVPDGDGSLVVWGLPNAAALDGALARWRSGAPAPPPWSGHLQPEALLARWKPTNPRAKELVAEALSQASRVDFSATVADDATRLELRMTAKPGEKPLVGSLGTPTADPPDVTALLSDDMDALVRLSANPRELWSLGRSLLTKEQQDALSELVETLRSEAALDVEKQIVDSLSGHVYVFAYERSFLPEPTLVDWLMLRATHEAVVLPLHARAPLRRALGAWTQLSRGRVQALTTAAENEEQKDEWGYFEDGELLFSVVLGANFVAFVDSTVALDRVRSWADPVAIPARLAERGVSELLEGRDRYGIYADRVLLEQWFGPLRYDAASATVTPAEGGEVLRAVLTHAEAAGTP